MHILELKDLQLKSSCLMGSRLGHWVDFSVLTSDLKLCMYDRNLFYFYHLACYKFPYESLEMCRHLVTAREYCMLNHIHLWEQLFQPLLLVIAWKTGLWYMCSLQKAAWSVEWVESWETLDLPQAGLRSSSVLDWSLLCILHPQDHVPGMDEEGY